MALHPSARLRAHLAWLRRGQGALQLRRPFGATLVWAAVVLAGLAAGVEIFARSEQGSELIPLRGVGSRHFQFEVKVDRLEKLAETAGPVDCLFLGDSTVHQAVDPALITARLKQDPGVAMTCFNFGVRGLNQAVLAPLAEILVDEYRPAWLLVGVNVTGLQRRLAVPDNDAILGSPWVRQRLGDPNWEGWLLDHSRAYRAFDPFRNWMQDDYLEELLWEIGRWRNMDPFGHLSPTTVLAEPLPDMTVPLNQAIAGLMISFEPSPENLAGLERTLELTRSGVQVVLVEIPVHAGFLTLLENGRADYDRGRQTVADLAQRHDAVFLMDDSFDQLIPLDGWSNLNHMNRNGSQIFSAWLSGRLAGLLRAGRLHAAEEPVSP